MQDFLVLSFPASIFGDGSVVFESSVSGITLLMSFQVTESRTTCLRRLTRNVVQKECATLNGLEQT